MNLYPGGVPNDNTMAMTIQFVTATFAQPCIDDASACPLLGVEPADGDDDGSLLQAAMRDHAGNVDPEVLLTSIYHDDRLGEGGWSNMTPVEHPDVRVPARLVVSWVDGLTADSALTHYASHPNTPLQVTIGSNTHPGGLDGDPFATTPFAEARPSARESFGDDIEFIQRVDSGESIAREIRYVVLGTDRWKTSDTWPPAGRRDPVAGAGAGRRSSLSRPPTLPSSLTASIRPPRPGPSTAGRASAAAPSTTVTAATRRAAC